jgi:peroxiredoxin
LQKIVGDIEGLGFKLIGVSADRVEACGDTAERLGLGFPLYSDARMEAANALGIAFRVDAETFKMLEGYGLHIEEASGHDHHILPVPAVFVLIDGVIRFLHIDPDHTKRLATGVLLKMLESATEGG